MREAENGGLPIDETSRTVIPKPAQLAGVHHSNVMNDVTLVTAP